MKLGSTHWAELRAALMGNPNITRFVSTGVEISEITNEQMVELENPLGLEMKTATEHEVDFDRVLRLYSERHPAVKGHIDSICESSSSPGNLGWNR